MRPDRQYRPLSKDDEQEGLDRLSASHEHASYTTRSRSTLKVCVIALLLSLALNILLALDYNRLRVASQDRGRTKYSQYSSNDLHSLLTETGGITFDNTLPFHAYSEYWNPNISDEEMDAAWDLIDTNPMAISLGDDLAKQLDLGPSTRFPWDTERSIYYIKGFHDLHCLVLPLSSSHTKAR